MGAEPPGARAVTAEIIKAFDDAIEATVYEPISPFVARAHWRWLLQYQHHPQMQEALEGLWEMWAPVRRYERRIIKPPGSRTTFHRGSGGRMVRRRAK